MCQQGESHVVSILTLIYFQSTPNRSWPTNVCCDAAQICPTPGFEHVCAVCCCVWGPALCKRGVRKHCFCKVSALRWGWCLCYLFPVAPARSPCVFFCVVFACGGGPLGLGEGHQACKVDRDFPHFPGVYSIYSYYTVYLHVLEQATSPPGQPGAPVGLLGLGEGHQACQSTEISQTSWRFFNLLFVYNVLTFFGAHHFSPRSAWCTHPGFL